MPSFDIVSKPNWAEIDNALNQASKEVSQRFDFRDTGAGIEKKTDVLHVFASTEDRVRAAWTVLEDKLVKRKVALRYFEKGEITPGPKGTSKLEAKVREGVSTEQAKEIVKWIKDTKLKVQASIQQELVRVSGKNRDDLQSAIQSLRGHDFGLELQFVNFRD